jgi:hypothetical protein
MAPAIVKDQFVSKHDHECPTALASSRLRPLLLKAEIAKKTPVHLSEEIS